MKTLSLVQGSTQWAAHRATHFNASDAPAMMGCSAYKTRTQLLHELHTGTAPAVDAATQRRFDEGHRIEALARPLAEKIIGEDLYPVVGVEGELSASFDGLTMAEDVCFEHKTLNQELRECMEGEDESDRLPLQYRVQMEQQLLVSGAARCLFMATKWDGDNLVESRHCWYGSSPLLRQQIIDGWKQFAIDLAAYVPQDVIVPAVAAPQMNLPAVSIQVTGSIALVDNLEKFGTALTAYIGRINKTPETDQDFADLEATVKTLKTAEEALDAAETNALAQTDSIDAMRRTVALYRETAKTNRLLAEKIVKAEKENRRTKILGDAVAALHMHTKSLNERTRGFMPNVESQFQEVIKGLKSLDSMKDKLAGELARCKIEANAIADRISFNLTLLDDNTEFGFLFPDAAQVVLKAADDFTALVNSRIAAHKAEAARKEEETRARIQAEEQAKAERAHAAKVEAERIEREQAEQAQAARIREEQAAFDEQERAEIARLAKLNTSMVVEAAPAAPAPELTHTQVVQQMPATVRQAMAPKPVAAPTMSLGEISTRLGFNVTSAFLASLGFEATTVKAAKLFHSEDFTAIGKAIIEHIETVCELQAA